MGLLILLLHPESAPSPSAVPKEGVMGFSRPLELPAYVLSADERLFSIITLPSYPGRGKEGIYAASSIPFFSIWCFSFVMLWTGSREQSWKWLLDCPGLYRHLNRLPKSILWKDWLPYVRVKITGLCSNLLISLLFMQQDERKKDPGHLEGWREGELLWARPADSLPTWAACAQATAVLQVLLPSQKSQGVSRPPSAEAGSCTEGFYSQDSSADTIVLQAAAGTLPVSVQYIPSSLFHSLSRAALFFRSLCRRHLETTQMSCKS